MKSKDDEPVGEGRCSKQDTGYGKDDGYDSGGDFIGKPGEMAKRLRGHTGGSLGGCLVRGLWLLETRLKLFGNLLGPKGGICRNAQRTTLEEHPVLGLSAP